MNPRWFWLLLPILLLTVRLATAQPAVAIPSTQPMRQTNAVRPAAVRAADQQWHSPSGSTTRLASSTSRNEAASSTPVPDNNIAPLEPLAPVAAPSAGPIAKIKEGINALPNQQGQIWREYDISPYTVRVTSTKRPEQAIVDWIFRDTGYEMWHSDIVTVLSADNRTLKVFHTPQTQAVVGELVDRFVNSEAETYAFSMRIITLDHPSWRSKAMRLMRVVPVQTQGIQAWIMAKEDAVLMLAELRKRTDFREHSSPQLLVNNGQSTVVASTRPRTYVRDIVARPGVWPGFETEMGQLDEGFSLEFSPLLSRDQRIIDAAMKCNIDQVEKLIPVSLDVPTPVTQNQRTQVDVPQVSQFRVHERFRWPADQVLVVGLGMVATPVATDPSALLSVLPLGGPPRADMLIFLEGKGKLGQAPSAVNTTQRDPNLYRGRY